MDPITAFSAAVGLCTIAWQAFQSFRDNGHVSDDIEVIKQDLSVILNAVVDLHDEIQKMRDQILQGIIEQILINEITVMNGDLLGLQLRFSDYPITGLSSSDQSDNLIGIINDAEGLIGRLSSQLDRCLKDDHIPFRYACSLFTLHSNTTCFLSTAMLEHSLAFKSDYRNKIGSKLLVLKKYAEVIGKKIKDVLDRSVGDLWVTEDVMEIQLHPNKPIMINIVSVKAGYFKGIISVDYAMQPAPISESKTIRPKYPPEKTPKRQVIDAAKNSLRGRLAPKHSHDKAELKNDPMLKMSQQILSLN